MGMTLKQAASTLGVSTSASKEEISEAYRELIKKCHPDMNRHADVAEKAKLDKMFKELVQARKVMLNPSLADPEPQPTVVNTSNTNSGTYSRPQQPAGANASAFSNMGGGGTSAGSTARTPHADDVYLGGGTRVTEAARIVDPYIANSSTSTTPPPVYNTATTFHTGTPRVKDNVEDDLADEYSKAAEKRYRTFADNIRFTTSLLSTALLVVTIGYLFAIGAADAYELLDIRNPIVLGVIAALVKLVIYDPLIAYHVRNRGARSIGRFAVTGVEMLVLGVAVALLFIFSGIDATLLLPAYAMCGAGVVCIVAGILGAMLKRRRAAKKAEKLAMGMH